MIRRRQPGEATPMGENFLACCYALIGLSALGWAGLKWTGRSIDRAVTLPAKRVAR